MVFGAMPVILLVGMPGAGKEEFVRVALKKGYAVIRMGDVVREYVQSMGFPLENKIVGKIAGEERDKHGVGIWARRTVEKIKRQKAQNVVIDGIRCMEEVDIYREEFGENVHLVGIFAPRRIRFERILKRARPDDVRTWEEFVAREERELSWGLGKVFALSDHMLLNIRTLEEYWAEVESFLADLEKT